MDGLTESLFTDSERDTSTQPESLDSTIAAAAASVRARVDSSPDVDDDIAQPPGGGSAGCHGERTLPRQYLEPCPRRLDAHPPHDGRHDHVGKVIVDDDLESARARGRDERFRGEQGANPIERIGQRLPKALRARCQVHPRADPNQQRVIQQLAQAA